MRGNSHKPLITTDEGAELAQKIHANRFIECSAKENVHIKEVIHEAVRAAVKGPIKVEEDKRTKRYSLFQCCQS